MIFCDDLNEKNKKVAGLKTEVFLLRKIYATYVRLIKYILPMLLNRYVTYSVACFFVENQPKANEGGG